jgi:type II secretory pathway component PulK
MKLEVQPASRTHSFALIIALMAVFVLSASAAGLWYSMQVDMHLAARSQSQPNMVWLGRSGVQLACYVLAQEASVPNEPYDAFNQFWAGGPGGPGETNSALANLSLDHFQIADGWVSIKIIDLERYANINTATPQLINQVLTTMGVDANDMSTISDSILDWVQPGDNPRLAGAKNEYYLSLNPPYYCKEAPMDDISELLLVKGVTGPIYNGGTDTNSATPKKFGFSPFENNNYAFGLKDVFTPFSDGRINVNTADANVLQCLPGMDQATAENIIKTRAGPDGIEGTSDDTPFQNPGEVAQKAGVSGLAAQSISQYCDVHSRTFKVLVTAHYLNLTRQYVGIVWRNTPQNVQVVGFYWQNADTAGSN